MSNMFVLTHHLENIAWGLSDPRETVNLWICDAVPDLQTSPCATDRTS